MLFQIARINLNLSVYLARMSASPSLRLYLAYLIRGYVVESLHCADVQCTLHQYMCPEYVVLGERQRIAEAQVDMSLRREMEDRVDVILAKALEHIGVLCDVAMVETEIRPPFQHSGVVS